MPFVKVNIHFVWNTKNREPFLSTREMRDKVWQHIRENAVTKGIYIDFINGHQEHCHCLISLSTEQTIKKVMQLVKGECSFWINRQPDFLQALGGRKFEWQDEYFAVSISESQMNTVRNYIKKQEEHHKKKTFQQEHDEFILRYGFQKFKD